MVNKYNNIPMEMKSLKRFVGWEKDNIKGKVLKLPFSLIDGKRINWHSEDRWLSYEEIENKNQNLGFVLNDDHIFCIDLDNAIADGKLTNLTKDIIKDFKRGLI